MSTPAHDDEPITRRVTKAIDEKMLQAERRSYDWAWKTIQPVAAYLIIALISGGLALWQGQTTHGQEIRELRQTIARLDSKNDTVEELRREVIDLKARRDEFNRWRDATDRRIGDLATMILDRGKQKDVAK